MLDVPNGHRSDTCENHSQPEIVNAGVDALDLVAAKILKEFHQREPERYHRERRTHPCHQRSLARPAISIYRQAIAEAKIRVIQFTYLGHNRPTTDDGARVHT